MDEVVYVVEKYVHWEGSEILGVYTHREIAVEKILKLLEKKIGPFIKLTHTDEWSRGDISYLINEIPLNQDITLIY